MKNLKKNLWRHVLQLGVITVIAIFILKVFFGGTPADVEAYCPFGGLQSLVTYLNAGTLACSMSMTQIMIGIVLAVGVFLFSKLFCGYICPLGTVTEWMGRLRKKMKINIDIRNGSIADKALRIIKYGLLFITFYFTITSSELFCKNFDPYYAIATGFKGELTAWMAAISIAILFLGNFLINMFWCKYVCPLGALSNIFKFTITFVVLLILSLIAGHFGLTSHWIWLLAATCIICYILEIVFHESKVFPLLKVCRDEESCIDCGKCSKRCPMKIDVAHLKVVKDVDCMMCGECIASCPNKSLTFNRRTQLRWLPAALTVVLFFVALWLGSHWELPTISEKWGDEANWSKLEMFEKEGMRTVKCFGSSKAFSAKMKQVPGVYGVTTYCGRFAVQVYYNPEETTREKVEMAMFTPTKMKLKALPAGTETLKIVTIGVEGLFDRMDMTFLSNIFKQHDGYYGLISEYDCPVKIRIYMDSNKDVDKKEIQKIVETREFEMLVHGGATKKVKCHYELVTMSDETGSIGRQDFLDMMFPSSSNSYSKNREKFPEDVETAVYELPYPGLDKPLIQRRLPYFSSFISNQSPILSYETRMKGDMPVIRITYVKGELDDDQIWEILQSPKWKIHFKDGRIEEQDPSFTFKEKGQTIEE